MRIALALLALLLAAPSYAADPLSGPQPGERLATFNVRDFTNSAAGVERKVEFAPDKASLTVFVHALERSLLPLLRSLDAYAASQAGRVNTSVIFLPADPVDSERRLPLVNRSLQLKNPMTLSVDGVEGPGAYGLSREVLMTVLLGQGEKATANFALVQPGIADADRIIQALARQIGDANPPAAQALIPAPGRGRMAARPAGPVPPTDLSRFDLNSIEGLRAALRALQAENSALRGSRGSETPPLRAPQRGGVVDREIPSLPAPLASILTAPPLRAMMQNWLEPAGDAAHVRGILQRLHILLRDRPELKAQAVAGWSKALELNLGNEAARDGARLLLDRLRQE